MRVMMMAVMDRRLHPHKDYEFPPSLVNNNYFQRSSNCFFDGSHHYFAFHSGISLGPQATGRLATTPRPA